jgi:hypothetical protein
VLVINIACLPLKIIPACFLSFYSFVVLKNVAILNFFAGESVFAPEGQNFLKK